MGNNILDTQASQELEVLYRVRNFILLPRRTDHILRYPTERGSKYMYTRYTSQTATGHMYKSGMYFVEQCQNHSKDLLTQDRDLHRVKSKGPNQYRYGFSDIQRLHASTNNNVPVGCPLELIRSKRYHGDRSCSLCAARLFLLFTNQCAMKIYL